MWPNGSLVTRKVELKTREVNLKLVRCIPPGELQQLARGSRTGKVDINKLQVDPESHQADIKTFNRIYLEYI